MSLGKPLICQALKSGIIILSFFEELLQDDVS